MFTLAVAVMQDRYIINGSQLHLTRMRWVSHLSFFASSLKTPTTSYIRPVDDSISSETHY